MEVTEHQAEIKECPLSHQLTTADFPPEVSQPSRVANSSKTTIIYIHQQHFVPLERTAEIIKDLYRKQVSKGTESRSLQYMAQQGHRLPREIKAGTAGNRGNGAFLMEPKQAR